MYERKKKKGSKRRRRTTLLSNPRMEHDGAEWNSKFKNVGGT